MKRKPNQFSKASPKPLPAPLTLDILRYSHDGRGIASHEGRVVMVANALPGEQVVATIDQVGSKLWQGRSTSIITASPERLAAPCKLYGVCGGCQLQHLQHAKQLPAKQQAVSEHLRRNGFKEQAWSEPLLSEPYGYRHRARFHVDKKGQVGFHAEKGNRLVPVAQCPVLTPALEQAYQILVESAPLIGIVQFELVVDDKGQVGVVVLDGKPIASADFYLWSNSQGWWSTQALSYQAGAATVTALPGEFTQVNRSVNQQMIEQARQWLQLTPTDRVLDLFCGNGNLSLALADGVEASLGLEASHSAIAQATSAAQGRPQIQFEQANLFTADLSKLAAVRRFEPTTMLLDPPRAGADALCAVLKKIPSVKKILYVSCDPATLARDLKLLADAKWRIRKIGLIDMFPQTRHIETMVYLEKRAKS
ncbi:MAG: 23S rRNA (uracil1939-C5)-methyltransferase [Reinekea sp.]